MSRHVRSLLCAYAAGELGEDDARRCAEHCAQCASCSGDLREIREALEVLAPPAVSPSEERDEEFWRAFAAGVEERLPAPRRRPIFAGIAAGIGTFIQANSRPLLAGSGVLALGALAAALLLRPVPPAGTITPPVAAATDTASVKLHDYLRKSKVLLIGVENARAEGGDPVDLSLERRQSRALVREARFLKGQPLDARSARLVGELEKIMIQLANSDKRHDAGGVEIVRSGIRQNNLLFKIRMTESVLDAGTAERNAP